jgi:hypothetical protein
MNKINKKNPLTLDRMLYLICYNWGICSEVEEIITKLVFWGDWRPSLLECPRLNFAKVATKYGDMAKLIWTDTDSLCYTYTYPPSTAPRLDKISIYKENLTRSDIIEIKKYYLARVFTTRFSAFRAVDGPCIPLEYRNIPCIRSGIIKKPYRKLSIKTFNGEVGRYCAEHYW